MVTAIDRSTQVAHDRNRSNQTRHAISFEEARTARFKRNDARLVPRASPLNQGLSAPSQLPGDAASAVCLKTVVAAPIMDDTSLRFAGTISVLPSLARLPNRSR